PTADPGLDPGPRRQFAVRIDRMRGFPRRPRSSAAMTTAASRAAILTLLAAVMAATRLHHFGAVPDASWAVFFVGGFYLYRWTRWAFPLLMALAVLVDWIVIRGQGLDFWSHYCVSPGYWALLPAHLA